MRQVLEAFHPFSWFPCRWKFISIPNWKVRRWSSKVQLNCSMISWSLWMFTFLLFIVTPCIAISLVTSTTNSCPGSTWRTLGHLCGTHINNQSTLLLDYSKGKQLLEASSPIGLISFQMWNLSLDCKGRWKDIHLKINWIA